MAPPLDQAVWSEIRKHLVNPELLLKAYEQRGADGGVDSEFLDGQVRAAQQRLKQAQGGRGRLLDAFQGGHLEKKEFEVRMNEVRARVGALDLDLKAPEEEHRRARGGMAFLESIGGFTRAVTDKLDSMPFHERQALARSVLDEVVLNGKDITLHFKIPLPRPGPGPAGDTAEKSAGPAVSSEFLLRSRPDEAVEVNIQGEVTGASLDDRDGSGVSEGDGLEAEGGLGFPLQVGENRPDEGSEHIRHERGT